MDSWESGKRFWTKTVGGAFSKRYWNFKKPKNWQSLKELNFKKGLITHLKGQLKFDDANERGWFEIFQPFSNMEGKSSTQRARFLRGLANRKCPNRISRPFWIWKYYLSPNFSKFPVECDWNIKISQICSKLRFFWKKCWVFRNQLFKIVKGGKFAAQCESNDIISLKCVFSTQIDFLQKNQEIFEFSKIW